MNIEWYMGWAYRSWVCCENRAGEVCFVSSFFSAMSCIHINPSLVSFLISFTVLFPTFSQSKIIIYTVKVINDNPSPALFSEK